jgi:hypothetical protein
VNQLHSYSRRDAAAAALQLIKHDMIVVIDGVVSNMNFTFTLTLACRVEYDIFDFVTDYDCDVAWHSQHSVYAMNCLNAKQAADSLYKLKLQLLRPCCILSNDTEYIDIKNRRVQQ